MSKLKDLLREVLITLRLDLTKNLKYDRLTRIIIKKHIKPNYNCIDIGCHKGEILDIILACAPPAGGGGMHFAFEPIPSLFQHLKRKYGHQATILPYALSDHSGLSTFQLVKNAPAYSGLKIRHYDIANPDIEQIQVEMKTLDELIPPDLNIHFIKIDVEGGEMGVLKGAKRLLKAHRPLIIFECGKGASDYYGTSPADVYRFLTADMGLQIFTLSAFVNEKQTLSIQEFENCFHKGLEYYYVASPPL